MVEKQREERRGRANVGVCDGKVLVSFRVCFFFLLVGERTSTAPQLGCTGVIAVHSDSLLDLFSQFAASSAARGGYRIRQTRRGITHAFFLFFSFPFSGCDSDSESSQQYTRPARFGRKSPFGLGLGGSDSDLALGLGLGLCQVCVRMGYSRRRHR